MKQFPMLTGKEFDSMMREFLVSQSKRQLQARNNIVDGITHSRMERMMPLDEWMELYTEATKEFE